MAFAYLVSLTSVAAGRRLPWVAAVGAAARPRIVPLMVIVLFPPSESLLSSELDIDISKVSNHNELYYASVDIQNGKLVEAGSRTVAVVGIADSISSAEIIAENEIKSITGPLFHRKDIGKDELIQKRIDHMRSLR